MEVVALVNATSLNSYTSLIKSTIALFPLPSGIAVPSLLYADAGSRPQCAGELPHYESDQMDKLNLLHGVSHSYSAATMDGKDSLK